MSIKIFKRSGLVAAVALAAILSGCTERMSVLEDFVSDEMKKAPPPLPSIPPIRTFPVVELPIEGLRDPFQTDSVLSAEEAEAAIVDDPDCPDLTRVPENLEKFPLDALDMVGTMAQANGYYGLVKDPEGVVHRVQVNNYLGQNFGQILSIADSGITVEERVKDGNGCERREQSIALDDNN